ncbi:hypothetical protein [Mucilaginibacter sp.]
MKQNNQPITYPYSRTSTYLSTAFIIGVVVWSIPHLLKFVEASDVKDYMLIVAFDVTFIVMAVIVVVKYTIPAILGQIALELNNEELVSYMRNVSIPWNDIEDIDLRSGKSSSSLYITFKVETDHGSHIRIPLQFVMGKDEDIYETVKAYKQHSHTGS